MKSIKKLFQVSKSAPDSIKAISQDNPCDLYGYASVEVTDTVGDVVKIAGITTQPYHNPPKRYMKILPQHKTDGLPIGRVEQFIPVDTTVNGTVVPALAFGMSWAKDGEGNITADAKKYKDLFDGGYLDSFSVGMMVCDCTANNTDGLDIIESQLYEISAVTVPANAEANVIKMIEDTLGEQIITKEVSQKKSVAEIIAELNGSVKSLQDQLNNSPKLQDMKELLAMFADGLKLEKPFEKLNKRLDLLESIIVTASDVMSQQTRSRTNETTEKQIKSLKDSLQGLNEFLNK